MLLVMLLLATIGLRSGQVGGIPIFDDGDSKKKAAEFALTDVRALFPSASTYKRTDTDVIKVFNGQIQLGTIISSSPLADSIAGYASSVPVLIGVNMSNKIVGVRLLKNYESADFVAKIYRSGFLESWTGKSVHDGAALKTDGVSGATVTSQALISTIRFSLSRQSSKELDAEQGLTLAQLLRLAAAFTLLAASIAQLIYPAKLKRFRIPLQIATIAVVGFWIGDSLSMQLLYSGLISWSNAFPKAILGSSSAGSHRYSSAYQQSLLLHLPMSIRSSPRAGRKAEQTKNQDNATRDAVLDAPARMAIWGAAVFTAAGRIA